MNKTEKTKIPKAFIVIRIIGFILLAVAVCSFIAAGVADIFALFPVGGVGLVIGIFLTIVSFMPNLQKLAIKTSKYIIEENKQDLKDISSSGAEIVSEGVTKVTKAVKKGLTEDDSEKMYCKYCGGKIDKDSKFCSFCGGEQ